MDRDLRARWQRNQRRTRRSWSGSAYQVQPQSYALTVGAGGAAAPGANGVNGGSSSLFGVTVGGGIAPTLANQGVGGASASGFVGGQDGTTRPGGEPGGGGGDAGAGGNGTYNPGTGVGAGGTGGIGTYSSITGTSAMYGFGGGGGSVGAVFQNGDGTTGRGPQANSGGGGAGGAGAIGNGAAGTVIVRYQGAAAATGGTVASGTGSSAGYTVQTFNTTGAGSLDFSAVDFNARLGTTATGLISGGGALTFNGPGRLTLTGNNTYTGATNVTAGRLYVDGNQAAATGAGSVQSGALLGGSGTVGGSVTALSGGTLAPGDNAPGRLTIDGDVSLNNGSFLAIEVGGTTPGTGYSQGMTGGRLTLGGSLSVSEVNGFTLAVGQKFNILVDTGTSAVSGTFPNTTSNGTLYSDGHGDTFYVNYADSAGDGTDGNDVTLTVLTVPEPRVWQIVAAGLGGLCAVMRHRRRSA